MQCPVQHKLSCHTKEDNLGILAGLPPLCLLLAYKPTEISIRCYHNYCVISPTVICLTLWLASNINFTTQTQKPGKRHEMWSHHTSKTEGCQQSYRNHLSEWQKIHTFLSKGETIRIGHYFLTPNKLLCASHQLLFPNTKMHNLMLCTKGWRH